MRVEGGKMQIKGKRLARTRQKPLHKAMKMQKTSLRCQES
jgi:hypothetical protein